MLMFYLQLVFLVLKITVLLILIILSFILGVKTYRSRRFIQQSILARRRNTVSTNMSLLYVLKSPVIMYCMDQIDSDCGRKVMAFDLRPARTDDTDEQRLHSQLIKTLLHELHISHRQIGLSKLENPPNRWEVAFEVNGAEDFAIVGVMPQEQQQQQQGEEPVASGSTAASSSANKQTTQPKLSRVKQEDVPRGEEGRAEEEGGGGDGIQQHAENTNMSYESNAVDQHQSHQASSAIGAASSSGGGNGQKPRGNLEVQKLAVEVAPYYGEHRYIMSNKVLRANLQERFGVTAALYPKVMRRISYAKLLPDNNNNQHQQTVAVSNGGMSYSMGN